MAESSTERAGVFISHIGQEHPVALVLQKYIRQAFGEDFSVFVSSDKRSIPGGEGWWQYIRSEIKKHLVVLSLLSDESSAREWINYEAGVGDGSGARVIPVAIKGYRFDKLDFPLKGFQGRYPTDFEGILLDISKQTGRVSGAVDMPGYLTELRQAEDSLIYENLIFRPIKSDVNRHPSLLFELQNQGNVDIELLFAEVWVPRSVTDPNWGISNLSHPPVMEVDAEPAGYLHVQHFNSSGGTGAIRRLEPVITRSMGVRRIRDLRFPLKDPLTADEENQLVRYQIHAKNFDTSPEEIRFKDIQQKPWQAL
jgi:hypothetical protein